MTKTAHETIANPTAATPMGHLCESMEALTDAVRIATNKGDVEALRMALKGLRRCVDTMERWLDAAPVTRQ